MPDKQPMENHTKELIAFLIKQADTEISAIEDFIKNSYETLKSSKEKLVQLRQALTGAIKYIEYKNFEVAEMKANIEKINEKADKVNSQLNLIEHLME